jgi:hypothetical protein
MIEKVKAFIDQLPEPVIGGSYMLGGLVLFLHTIGAIDASFLIVLVSLWIMSYGFVLLHGPAKLRQIIDYFQNKDDNNPAMSDTSTHEPKQEEKKNRHDDDDLL